jgi:hypothetical protein
MGYRSGTYANNGAGVGPLTDGGSGSTTTVTLGAAATAGDCLLLAVGSLETGSHAAPTFTVSDSVNGAWSIEAVTATTTVVGLNFRSSIWLFPNTSSGTPVITVTVHGGAGHTYNVGMHCASLTSIVTTSPLDTSASGTGVSTSPSSGAVSPATSAGTEFMIGAYWDAGEGTTLTVGNIAGSAATLMGKHDADGGKWQGLIEYGDTGGSGSTPSATASSSGSATWIMLGAVLKVTGGGGAAGPVGKATTRLQAVRRAADW